jgi:hypothetical protein
MKYFSSMMRYCLALLITLSSFNVFAQTDNYIVVEQGIWSTLDIHCLPNGTTYSTYHIKFEGDTIIEDQAYKIIWRSDDELLLTWNFYGAIREDAQQQVFLRPPYNLEGKIYDFGCSVGDTIQTTNHFLSPDALNFVVTNIDSVLLLDRFRKRITVFEQGLSAEEVWIEGLGCPYGILSSSNFGYGASCGISEALCYEEAGLLVYQHPDYYVCHYDALVNTTGLKDVGVQIYPNPASRMLMVNVGSSNGKNQNNTLHIYSMDGKLIYEDTFSNPRHEIDLQSFPRGVFIVRLISGHSIYPPVKLLIE